ncbi:MAG: alpha/beta hydrolase, partial [Elainellaceae cyanobacterium]
MRLNYSVLSKILRRGDRCSRGADQRRAESGRCVPPRNRRPPSFILAAVLGGVGLGGIAGMASPAIAAERLHIQLGPIEQSVDIYDLEQFAYRGTVSSAMRPY